jgi:molybdopterin-guanine dinucleotide biosynthesis protein A
MIDRADITGLVLAGGRGHRMGGLDKGLQTFRGQPLALHVLRRLAPQVGPTMISANRNLAAYESFGSVVRPDADAEFAGPLAGFLVGLKHAETPYLMTVPCDSPAFPTDLVPRLASGLATHGADLAVVRTVEADGPALQPVFCLLRTSLRESLVTFMHAGGRKVHQWTAQHRVAEVTFQDAEAFFNANSLAELMQLEARHA